MASASKRINVPTFTIDGNQDLFFRNGLATADCSSSTALANFEQPYFGPNTGVGAKVIDDAATT